jgi:protocatechuate 3,4-dioxygenase beta subunit
MPSRPASKGSEYSISRARAGPPSTGTRNSKLSDSPSAHGTPNPNPMKPLGVLLLILVAVGGLLFAIINLGGNTENSDVDGIQPVTVQDTDSQSAPEKLPETASNVRVEADASGGNSGVRVAEELPEDHFANQLGGLVVTEEQQPIAGAKVTLTRAGRGAMMFMNDAQDRSKDIHDTTDEAGRYHFADIEPFDRYAIEVSVEGYSSAAVSNVRVGVEGPFNEPPIILTTGVKLYGQVVDSGKNPVPGATLHLDGSFYRAGADSDPERLTVKSDSAGNYEFLNVPPGNRKLTCLADGYANTVIGGLVFRGDKSIQEDVIIEIAERVEGIVVSQAGGPLAGASVQAMSFSNSNRQCRETTETDEQGRFLLERLAAGQYTISVRMDGYRPGHQPRVKSGESGLIIELVEQATIKGQVVASDTGKPVPRYEVRLRATYEDNPVTSPAGKKETFTEEDGSFSLAGVQPGTYLVQATANGYAPSYSNPFRITQGESTTGILVKLTKGGSITGTVIASDGATIPRALISTHDNTWSNSLFDQALGDEFPTNATLIKRRSNAKGKFRVGGLKAELYQVRINAPGYCEFIKQDVLVHEGNATSLGEIRLVSGGKITGQVLDAGGQTIAGANINLTPDGKRQGEMSHRYKTKSDAKGRYVLDSIWPGTYKITATAPGNHGDFLSTLPAQRDGATQRVTVKDLQELQYDLKAGK